MRQREREVGDKIDKKWEHLHIYEDVLKETTLLQSNHRKRMIQNQKWKREKMQTAGEAIEEKDEENPMDEELEFQISNEAVNDKRFSMHSIAFFLYQQ